MLIRLAVTSSFRDMKRLGILLLLPPPLDRMPVHCNMSVKIPNEKLFGFKDELVSSKAGRCNNDTFRAKIKVVLVMQIFRQQRYVVISTELLNYFFYDNW